MSSTNTIKPIEQTVLHSNAFSELVFYPEKSLIIAIWKQNSKKLVERGVIDEIARLLDYINTHQVRHVVVDVRHYPFTNNNRIQDWINSFYVPNLMESTVVKYAFVVEAIPAGGSPSLDEELQPLVEYFTSYEDAVCWMD
jgi:hypothetical protein